MNSKALNMIDAQVMGDWVTDKLTGEMRFAPLCTVEETLQGRAGDMVKVPVYSYIGDAAAVTEGGELPVEALTAPTASVEIKKAGNGVEITDESLYSGYGDPVGTALAQLTGSIAGRMDADICAVLSGIGSAMTHAAGAALSGSVIASALEKFGEKAGEEKVLFIAAEQLSALRGEEGWIPAAEIGTPLVKGCVGMIHGCQAVLSDRVKKDSGFENYIVMPGAVGLYLDRDTLVEHDRDIVRKVTVITADKHYAVSLRDPGRAVKLTCSA